ncbi:SMAD/FHA domain-containing protein [Jimgerdemannia flammicorona]|uniref:SMAD/FHA domain-containing protein n=1 Tax=Jimgerdemannia flammicorona TaxID=994334 RepID=A0A433DDP8_9FUNG|nr:SMAD/FHA domain-containing protein [Jimgerdemannia flammicorona]
MATATRSRKPAASTSTVNNPDPGVRPADVDAERSRPGPTKRGKGKSVAEKRVIAPMKRKAGASNAKEEGSGDMMDAEPTLHNDDEAPQNPHLHTLPWAVLTIVPGSREGTTIGCCTDHVRIGRSRTCAAQVLDQRVSSRHCELSHIDGRYFLRDKSHNGTYIAGRRLNRDEKIELHDGDEIAVIKSPYDDTEYVKFIFRTDPAVLEAFTSEHKDSMGVTGGLATLDLTQQQNLTVPPKNVHFSSDSDSLTDSPRRPEKIRRVSPDNIPDSSSPTKNPPTVQWGLLRSINPRHLPIFLTANTNIVGRQTLQPEQMRHELPSISYHHCTVARRAEGDSAEVESNGTVTASPPPPLGVYVRDESCNGTWVNGVRIQRNQWLSLASGDEIVLLWSENIEEAAKAVEVGAVDRNMRAVEVGYVFQKSERKE